MQLYLTLLGVFFTKMKCIVFVQVSIAYILTIPNKFVLSIKLKHGDIKLENRRD